MDIAKGECLFVKDFQDNLEKALNFRARAVFGWEGTEQPYILDLIKIEILLNLSLTPTGFKRAFKIQASA